MSLFKTNSSSQLNILNDDDFENNNKTFQNSVPPKTNNNNNNNSRSIRSHSASGHYPYQPRVSSSSSAAIKNHGDIPESSNIQQFRPSTSHSVYSKYDEEQRNQNNHNNWKHENENENENNSSAIFGGKREMSVASGVLQSLTTPGRTSEWGGKVDFTKDVVRKLRPYQMDHNGVYIYICYKGYYGD